MLSKILSRPFIHLQKSTLFIQHLSIISSLNAHNNIRYFADDPTKQATAMTPVQELDDEVSKADEVDADGTPAVIDPYEGVPLPPKMPSYQTKTPMELIAQVPIIEVDGGFVTCTGNYFNSDMTVADPDIQLHPKIGHPIQSIMLNTRIPYTPITCKYCGLRYVMRKPDGYKDPWEGYEKPASHEHYLDR